MNEKDLIRKAFEKIEPSEELIEKTIAMKNAPFSGAESDYGSRVEPAPAKPLIKRLTPVFTAIAGAAAAAALALTLPNALKHGAGVSGESVYSSEQGAAASDGSEINSSDNIIKRYNIKFEWTTFKTVSREQEYEPTSVWITNTSELADYLQMIKEQYDLVDEESFNYWEAEYDDAFFGLFDLLVLVTEGKEGYFLPSVSSVCVYERSSGVLSVGPRIEISVPGNIPESADNIQYHIGIKISKSHQLAGCEIDPVFHSISLGAFAKPIPALFKLADLTEEEAESALEGAEFQTLFSEWGEPHRLPDYFDNGPFVYMWSTGKRDIVITFNYFYQVSSVVLYNKANSSENTFELVKNIAEAVRESSGIEEMNNAIWKLRVYTGRITRVTVDGKDDVESGELFTDGYRQIQVYFDEKSMVEIAFGSDNGEFYARFVPDVSRDY